MVIATSSELLQSTELSARQRRLVERIDQASEEMRELVQTFILLARAESGNAIAGQESTLRLVAEEQAGRWAPEVRSRGLHFEMQVSADDDGHYNQTFLRVVIGNLLRNALHYTEQGEIRLSLEAGGFRVEDSGIGIADQDKAAVFQPFVRADKTRGDGLGLGLSLVRRICQQEGWTIAVDDRESGGSAFSVRLSG
jgi:signal transduction histidine kinase